MEAFHGGPAGYVGWYRDTSWHLRVDYLLRSKNSSVSRVHVVQWNCSIFHHTFKHELVSLWNQKHACFLPLLSHPHLLSCDPSVCWAAGPWGSSLLFYIVGNQPALGMEERNVRANATFSPQLLLAATATGAENQTYHFVIMCSRSRFPMWPSVCLIILFLFEEMILCFNWFIQLE